MDAAAAERSANEVVVYWRRGCLVCALLRRGLRRAGLTTVERDIWSDPDAAAFVRVHARGDETVPTVSVGDQVLVNPSTKQVLRAVEQSKDVPPVG